MIETSIVIPVRDRPDLLAACLNVLSKQSIDQLTAKADTVMFCLSKGLGAPVGSLLVGSAELMDRGRIYARRSEAACGRRESWLPPDSSRSSRGRRS